MPRNKRCFISSPYEDLREERAAARDAIERAGYKPIAMESFTSDPRPPIDLIRQLVDSSGTFVLLLGNRLGSRESATRKHFVELEYERAVQRGLPIYVFLSHEGRLVPEGQQPTRRGEAAALAKFRSLVQSRHTARTWDSPEALRSEVLLALSQQRLVRRARRGQKKTVDHPGETPPASPLTPTPAFSELVAWYERNIAEFDAIRAREELSIQTTLVRLVASGVIADYTVYSRVKSPSSLRGKLERPKRGQTYEALTDVGDLVGVRIVVFHEAEVDLVSRELLQHLPSSELHVREPENPLAFGYRSHHIQVNLMDSVSGTAGFRYEVQVRTYLQHVWAEIEHRLGYKASSYDSASKRLFAQVSALLEIADAKFSELKLRQEPNAAVRPRPGQGGARRKGDAVEFVEAEQDLLSEESLEQYFQSTAWDRSPFLKAILDQGFSFSIDLIANRSRSVDMANVCSLLASRDLLTVASVHEFMQQHAERLAEALADIALHVEFSDISPLFVLWIVTLTAFANAVSFGAEAEIRSMLDEHNLFVEEDRDAIADLITKRRHRK